MLPLTVTGAVAVLPASVKPPLLLVIVNGAVVAWLENATSSVLPVVDTGAVKSFPAQAPPPISTGPAVPVTVNGPVTVELHRVAAAAPVALSGAVIVPPLTHNEAPTSTVTGAVNLRSSPRQIDLPAAIVEELRTVVVMHAGENPTTTWALTVPPGVGRDHETTSSVIPTAQEVPGNRVIGESVLRLRQRHAVTPDVSGRLGEGGSM